MKIYKLNKTVLKITNNAAQFLNGLTSNTLDRPKNAFLDIHGKIIATFDQLKLDEDSVLIVLEKSFLEAVYKHIERFVKLNKAVVREEPYRVYFDLTGEYPLQAGEFFIPQRTGRLILTGEEIKNSVSDEEFTLFRLQNQIPLHGVDYREEMVLNVSADDYVSFTKGCFLGQEPVSKVHHRSKPTWRLVVADAARPPANIKQPMTSSLVDPATKRVLGFAFVPNE